MNKRKIKEIVKFSLQKNIQNKWFILLNIIVLISTVAMTNVDNIKNFMKNNNLNFFDKEMTIEIIDDKNLAKDNIINEFEGNENIKFVDNTNTEYNKDNILDDYIIIEINESDEYIISSKITSKEGIDGALYDPILEALKKSRSQHFADTLNIDTNKLEILNQEPNIERIMLGVDSENSDSKQTIKTISTFIIYFISIFIFSSIANEIAQEKVSKSIEYVLTSITAEEYLLAKIISVMGFILIQGIHFFVYYLIGNLINNIINMGAMNQIDTMNTLNVINYIDKDIVIYLATVFTYGMLTLVLMSIIQAALSSKTTNMSEAGNTVSFLMTITIIMYFVTLFAITPYTKMSTFLYIISCIPLVSNYFIPAIMIIGQATPLQIIVSLLLLIISIPITFKVCAKMFKNGVLDYKGNAKSKKKIKKEKTVEESENDKILLATFRKFSFVIGSAIVFWIVIQVICSLLLGIIGTSLLNGILSNTQISLVLMGVTSIISIIIPVLFVSMYIEDGYKVKKSNISIKNLAVIILITIFVIGILQIGISYIYPKVGLDYNIIDTIQYGDNEGILTSILYFVCIAIIPAVFEELLFRKVIIDYSRKIGNVFAIIISSIIFGVIHLNIGQGIFAFIMGLILAIIYTKTGSVKTTMIIHFLNNGFAALTVIFSNSVGVIDIIAIGVMIIGFILLVKKLIENKAEIKSLKIEKVDVSKYKYLLCDYTFIVTIIVTVLIFISTENMLRM